MHNYTLLNVEALQAILPSPGELAAWEGVCLGWVGARMAALLSLPRWGCEPGAPRVHLIGEWARLL